MNNLKYLKLQRKFKFLFDSISYLEDFLIKNKIKDRINFDKKCIFVTGMPRSGTTILTHIISNFDEVGSYNYSDLPFIKTPFLWSKINKLYYYGNKQIERVHGDGLQLKLSSPDAFEELIWSENIKDYKDGNFSKLLDHDYKNDKLEFELMRAINKILILRKKKVYLSKGNYNLFRINYLRKIFKNSYFLICLRNPLNVIKSSIKVHKRFLEYDYKDNDFTDEMSELCHFEFGKNRISPFKDNKEHDELKYYQNQWIKTHQLILEKYLNLENVILINYDELIIDPVKSISLISKKINEKYSESLNDIVNIISNNNTKLTKIDDGIVKNIYSQLLEHCIN